MFSEVPDSNRSARNWQHVESESRLLLVSFLLGLFFVPEEGDEMLLRYIGWPLPDYTALLKTGLSRQ